MNDLSTQAVMYLISGALIIGAGGVLADKGLRLLEKHGLRAFFWIATSALIIGSGALLTTLGWDRIETKKKRRQTMAAVIREWEFNEGLFARSPLLQGDTVAMKSPGAIYPRFQNTAVMSALTSTVIGGDSELDKELLNLLSKYSIRLQDFHARLNYTEKITFGLLNQDSLLTIRQKIPGSTRWTWFTNIHREPDSFFTHNLPWVDEYRSTKKPADAP